jgi:hypothetical protein
LRIFPLQLLFLVPWGGGDGPVNSAAFYIKKFIILGECSYIVIINIVDPFAPLTIWNMIRDYLFVQMLI